MSSTRFRLAGDLDDEIGGLAWRNGIDSPYVQPHRKDPQVVGDGKEALTAPSPDYELIAQELSGLREKVSRLDNRMSDVLSRLAEVEKVNARLEDAALTTARALQEISGHWEALYEAMRRKETSQVAPER